MPKTSNFSEKEFQQMFKLLDDGIKPDKVAAQFSINRSYMMNVKTGKQKPRFRPEEKTPTTYRTKNLLQNENMAELTLEYLTQKFNEYIKQNPQATKNEVALYLKSLRK